MLEVRFDTFPEIRTPRLHMREILLTDAETWFHVRTHPEVMRYLDRDPDPDVEAVRNIIATIRTNFEAGDGIAWALTLKEDPGTIFGSMAIWRIEKHNHRGEVGYAMHPDYWGKGLMAEAMEAAIQFGFHTIGLHSMEANTSVGNTASHALLKKFGFVLEGHFKENWYYKGKFSDSMIFSLLTPLTGK
jgi:[ribosomal protein S5]-alanine N-acetyltransferase